jgi:hypothetical protein
LDSSEKPQEQAGNKPKTTEATMKSFEEKNTRIERNVLIPMFKAYLGEEILALVRAITAVCIAYANKEHPWHELSKLVLPKIFEDSTSVEAPTAATVEKRQAKRYVDMLLKEYSIRAGIEEEINKDVKGKGKELVLSSASSLLAKPGTASKPSEQYRSTDPSQVLLEQHAILELLFWFLWPGFLPWSQAALPVLTLAYRSDLGLRFASPSSQSHYARGGSERLSSSTSAYLYLEDKEKVVMKRIEMMWMLLCVAVFDVAHLINGPVVLSPSSITTGAGEDEEEEEQVRYRRIYDPRLLPKIHALVHDSPHSSRYSPILLTYAFLLSKVSQAAVQLGEDIPKTYIPFLQLIIPDFSVDTVQERSNEIGRWLSSLIAGFVVQELSVLEYLESAIRTDEGGVFGGEGRVVGFGPPIYRVVVKRE